MHNRRQDAINDTPIKAYRYTRDALIGASFTPFLEYWIPDYNITISENTCATNKEPQHISNSRHTGKYNTLTATTLSSSLANDLRKLLDHAEKIEITEIRSEMIKLIDMNNKNEFAALWVQPSQCIKEPHDNAIRVREPTVTHEFRLTLDTIGNDALKEAFETYILFDQLPDQHTLNDLIALFNNLDTREQSSIIESIRFEIMQKHHSGLYQNLCHQPMISHPATLPRISTSTLANTCTAIATGAVIGSALSKNPLVGLAGIALSGVTLFSARKYDNYQASHLITARHQRAEALFKTLHQTEAQRQTL